MKFILIIICLLLLFYQFESTQILNKKWDDRIVLFWNIERKALLHIFPHDEFVLIDGKSIYFYLDDETSTYVSAINIEDNSLQKIVNYKYLLDWSHTSPKILSYPKHLQNVIEIVNYIGE